MPHSAASDCKITGVLWRNEKLSLSVMVLNSSLFIDRATHALRHLIERSKHPHVKRAFFKENYRLSLQAVRERERFSIVAKGLVLYFIIAL